MSLDWGSSVLAMAGRAVTARLRAAGHEAWFVGGCVRDALLGVELKDIDIATSATPGQVGAIFPGSRFVGAKFGVALVRERGLDFEVATFRRDGAYLDHRRPATVSFGSRQDDTRRRDFTVNALFADPVTGEVIDEVGGRADLDARLIRCVGDPAERIREDALRMLRAVRFAARFGFEIEPATIAAIRNHAETIEFISPERQRIELTGFLTGPHPGRGLQLLHETALLRWVLPEIDAMRGVEQGAEYHPEGDVFVHTCLVLDKLEPRSAINAWAALLHDVGKPRTIQRGEDGAITFYNHHNIGAEMAEAILGRLRFSTDEIETIRDVVARHMTFMNITRMRASTFRRFVGSPTIDHDLAVHRADCLGSLGRLDYYEYTVEKMRELQSQAGGAMPPPLITGHDIMDLGIPAGPLVGEWLRRVQDLQLEGGLTTRKAAIDWLRAQNGLERPPAS